MVGDFNIIRKSVPVVPCLAGAGGELSNLIVDFDLMQLNKQPSGGLNILDLVLVSRCFFNAVVYQAPLYAGSDHRAQVIVGTLSLRCQHSLQITYLKLDMSRLQILLGRMQWPAVFSSCRDVDEYVEKFDDCV